MTLEEFTAALGRDVSRETFARLEAFAALVHRWNPAINLVAKSTLPHLWHRHILDSAQILGHARDDIAHWADLGSGGGFPGIIIAVLLAQDSPQTRVTLVESDQRKATFLAESSRQLGLNPVILTTRAESTRPLAADVISARALAPLPRLLPLIALHAAPQTIALLPKGAGYQQELAEAAADWRFTSTAHPSITDPKAVILELRNLTHV
ncbi:16S rRNA (guanine(527)-N(7))-methyltransferase RsmG [Ruixingdingia sedimenti]|uniref:Ribosomal RNA small subunit methyltransferase G n=1 Tax=Ruixingdingia sedimenti TaxID=3073604 RepID=A0ABU1F704_9RHOB|nr:16S rRNA (guanine(527)-N(7))-methyltransferase RsmG [Xinfangfangia sp. LG-4]MDR5652661.1 16S rRNA (guanine(527)-N(7))-methyltransferase RsmG [Xinfangfangia sp. LG-4]